MFRTSLTILIVFTTFSSVHAKTFLRRHTLGQIIVGCVIGGLGLISLLVGFCLLSRRRRTRAATFHSGFSGQPPPHSTGWSRISYQGYQTQSPPYASTHDAYRWYGPEGPKYPHSYPYVGTPYPSQSGHYPPAVPPPAYTQPGNP
ncbi:hypothetical protein Ac2012v2_002899 [Leucoagaricus gongylophorus]